jgi:hypothetical protein
MGWVQSVDHARLGNGVVVRPQPGAAPGPHLIWGDEASRPALGYGRLIEFCFASEERARSYLFGRSPPRPSVLRSRGTRRSEQRRIDAETPPDGGKLVINAPGRLGETRQRTERAAEVSFPFSRKDGRNASQGLPRRCARWMTRLLGTPSSLANSWTRISQHSGRFSRLSSTVLVGLVLMYGAARRPRRGQKLMVAIVAV